MRIEPKQAFYNDETGAVQPWKDIEVTDAVGNTLVAEGLVTEIEGGGGDNKLSFANVTITNNTSDDLGYLCVYYAGNGYFNGGSDLGTNEFATIEAILYEQAAHCQINATITLTDENVVITGDASIVDVDGYTANLIISGDCTITITE